MTTVLIVDDLSSIREFLKINLSSEPDITIVGLADDGDEAIAQVEEHRPDVVLMDIDMPGRIDGIQATKEIARRFSQVKVLLLTSKDDRAQLNLALQVGSRGYILKNTSVKDIADIIRLAQKGFFQIGPILGNWNGSLHNNLQANSNNGQIARSFNQAEAIIQQDFQYPYELGNVSEMNQVLSNLTSGIFQLQEIIKSQEDMIVNLTNQYSQVQQEIRTKLKRDKRLYNTSRTESYVQRAFSKSRTPRQHQHLLLISSFFLGVFTVLILMLVILTFGTAS